MSKPIPSFLEKAPQRVRKDFLTHALFKRFARGEQLTSEGSACHYFPIVQTGVIRVYKVGANGQEMTLYRIQRGEGCVLTMTCMMNESRFPAFAEIEETCEVFLIPANIFRSWVTKYDFWREFVVEYLTRVVSNVVNLIEEISFKKLDLRIMEFLIRHVQTGTANIRITHQKLARELGTAREVVSRTLKQLEHEKLVRLERGAIVVLDMQRLQSKARVL